MPTYAVEQLDTVTIAPGSPLDGMDLMSPFVWREGDRYRMLVRGVPDPMGPRDPTGLIASGWSDDGLAFTLDQRLAIAPGTDPADADAGGCEDPTVLRADDGSYVVYYTGVDAARSRGVMISATGPSLDALVKRRVELAAPEGEGNIKEATFARTPAGDWRLFYEYAAAEDHGVGASRVGVARAATLGDPWTALADPFPIRGDSWDNWHLSTGPICCLPGADPVMFYNGATLDARWRIGWISFDARFATVTGRGLEPLILPPPPEDRSKTDIAFAASTVVEDGMISLYFSLEDRILRRARIRYYA
ncbi:glycosidase [Sphingomonas sp. A2-49]|uniref:glycosidase n=1 Tax=Sphingomonas sp. A2-49 TaxID=1391375 RepID=UPI0021D0C305|nr:glycosidase [Sphingomonas sp. A2-49]MCU6452663.1 glycosidase [Sphingomonas sp. A2-49]